MYKKLKVALVVPAYNEQRLIKPTITKTPRTIDRVYVIDDGSKDKTASVVKAAAKKDRRIKLLQHKKNQGLNKAIITGYLQAAKDKYDITVVVGGDNQMDLADLNNFLEPIANGEADYTKGNRFIQTAQTLQVMPKQRLFGNNMLSLLTKFATGYWKVFDSNDGYTALTKRAIDAIDWSTAKTKYGYGYNAVYLHLLNLKNFKVKDVPRRAVYLKGERQSQIKTLKYMSVVGPRLVKLFFKRLFTKYYLHDFHPLLFFYILGMLFVPIGLIVGLYILLAKLSGGIVTSATAVLSALFLISGIQFLLFAMLYDMELNDKLQP